MTDRLDAIVIAQYFQPAHAGHLKVMQQAAELGRQTVVLCLGADAARSLRAPWTTSERVAQLAIAPGPASPSGPLPVRDVPYDLPRWRQAIVAAFATVCADVARVGVISDADLGAVWPVHWTKLTPVARMASVEAALREQLFWVRAPDWKAIDAELTAAQGAALRAFGRSAECDTLRTEATFIREFRAQWESAPYPPVFVTTDGVVTWRDEVLLIKRGRPPGLKLWALPGGFLDVDETLAEGLRREVREETALILDPSEMREVRVFDAPRRSLRGRTVTHAYHYDLAPRRERPRVAGGDDALQAHWVRRSDLAPTQMFEDHYAILQVMLGLD